MFNFLDQSDLIHRLKFTLAPKKGIILAKEFQEHLTKNHLQNGVIDQGKLKKINGKKMDRQTVSCSR